MDFSSDDDFERARREFLSSVPRRVLGRFAHSVWGLDDYRFLDEPSENDDVAPTVNLGLWRQKRLNNIAKLFKVVPSIYQVRGMDISNVTFIAGATAAGLDRH